MLNFTMSTRCNVVTNVVTARGHCKIEHIIGGHCQIEYITGKNVIYPFLIYNLLLFELYIFDIRKTILVNFSRIIIFKHVVYGLDLGIFLLLPLDKC